MARVKRSVNARKKRRTTFERAKGYYGARSRTYRSAKEQVQHSLQYQYRDRRNKKREFRRLWIQRINAGCHANDLSYSQFMHGLKLAGVELDRKVLAQIAYDDADTFASLCDVAKKALGEPAAEAEVEAEAAPDEEPVSEPVAEAEAEAEAAPAEEPAPEPVAETQEPDPAPEEAAE